VVRHECAARAAAGHRISRSCEPRVGAIEHDADVVTFIDCETGFITDGAERAKVERDSEVIIGKQRHGPTGAVHLIVRGEHTRIEDPTVDAEPRARTRVSGRAPFGPVGLRSASLAPCPVPAWPPRPRTASGRGQCLVILG